MLNDEIEKRERVLEQMNDNKTIIKQVVKEMTNDLLEMSKH